MVGAQVVVACRARNIYGVSFFKNILAFMTENWLIHVLSWLYGYMSFRPTPFQPLQFQQLQFQPLQFQPFTPSTVHTFNRLPFRPLANSTATNSTCLIKFKVIQFFQDVRK